jgi:hypothetical protein
MFGLLSTARHTPELSTSLCSPENTFQIIENCDIGFVGYRNLDDNFFHIDMASGQAVEFFRLGKPIITLGQNTLCDFVRINHSGIHINHISEMNAAIQCIMNDYATYSHNSRSCFEKYFDSQLYIDKLLEWI